MHIGKYTQEQAEKDEIFSPRGEEYEIRIELKRQGGAFYYYRKKGDTEWNILSNSTYGVCPALRVSLCAWAGNFAVDDIKITHRAYGPLITAPIFQDQTVTLRVTDNAGQEDTESVTINVEKGDPPQAVIAAPGSLERILDAKS